MDAGLIKLPDWIRRCWFSRWRVLDPSHAHAVKLTASRRSTGQLKTPGMDISVLNHKFLTAVIICGRLRVRAKIFEKRTHNWQLVSTFSLWLTSV
jgi:hypothetical protein